MWLFECTWIHYNPREVIYLYIIEMKNKTQRPFIIKSHMSKRSWMILFSAEIIDDLFSMLWPTPLLIFLWRTWNLIITAVFLLCEHRVIIFLPTQWNFLNSLRKWPDARDCRPLLAATICSHTLEALWAHLRYGNILNSVFLFIALILIKWAFLKFIKPLAEVLSYKMPLISLFSEKWGDAVAC